MSDIDKQPHGLILTPGSYTGELLMTEEEKRAINPPSANYADSTTKCPMCGSEMKWNAFSGSCTNIDCLFFVRTNAKELRIEMAYDTALHRIRELEAELSRTKKDVEWARQQLPFQHHTGKIEDCPTFYDGCNCTVENLAGLIEKARDYGKRIKDMEAENARLREALKK